MSRRLRIAAERLAPLTEPELESVAAGLPTQMCTGYYPTVLSPCPTVVWLTETVGTR